ncbi:MAG: MASE3 domain-containing protein [Pseudomonadota bacterium]
MAALVFFTGHGVQETLRSIRSVALGCAFLAVALFDTLHFLSYIGMPDLVSPNSPHKSILFWLCGRLAAGIGLLAYVRPPPRVSPPAATAGWSFCCCWGACRTGCWPRPTPFLRCMSWARD